MFLGGVIAALDALTREATLFASVGFLAGGLDDLAVDLVYFARAGRIGRDQPPAASSARSLAIFLPAWDESAVIRAMLTNALATFDHDDYRIYVGVYPNDHATLAAVAAVAAQDGRVRLTVGARPGPTTKGDNLNTVWRSLLRDEAEGDWRADAVVLHDAEDVVDPSELRLFDRLLSTYSLVQLPVLPLIAGDSRWVSAHYADEFVEVQARQMVVRQALGAGLPLAGTGCAIRRDALDRVAAARGGSPFDATSLTEDYELGLAVAAAGGRGCFARARDPSGRPIAVRAYFPRTVPSAVRQKARWMAGIALIGWDKLGWRGSRHPGELWMRMRDRRGPLSMLVLAVGYVAMGAGAVAAALHVATAAPVAAGPAWLAPLLAINSALLVWRLTMRGLATGRAYGWREGVRAVPRVLVSNFVSLLATRRAVTLYLKTLRGATPQWDKTAHDFPADPAAVR